jgi:hypothetical protein
VSSLETAELFSPLTTFIAAGVLVAVVFAVYGPALNFQFILDDHRFVGDPRLQSSGHLWEYFTNYVWAQSPGGPVSFYRPVFVMWLRLNFVLMGASPWGWHLLSIVKHVVVAALLGLLVWKLLRDRAAALIAGTLFALHPAQTESVAWVTVPDPLMSAAVLGSILLYLGYAELSANRRLDAGESSKKLGKRIRSQSKDIPAGAWIAASSAACFGALLAKETAVVLPVALFGVALTIPAPTKGMHGVEKGIEDTRNRLLSALRQMLPFLGVTLLYLILRAKALKGELSPLTQHLPWQTVLLSWPATLWFYVKVLFWPVRPRAFADPILTDAFSLRSVALPGVGVCCAAIVLAGGCVWAWRRARQSLPEREAVGVERALLLGTALLGFPILLVLNLNGLNPGDFLHGRYTYLPLAGLMLLLVTGWRLAGKARVVLLVASGAVAVAFGVLTVQQESAWSDDMTVFTVAHRYAPHNEPVKHELAKANVQIALGLDEQDRCDEAMPMFEEAIRQYPQDWYAWAGQGECFFKLNDLLKAEQSLHRAADLSHETRVIGQWQELRARMGLAPAPAN